MTDLDEIVADRSGRLVDYQSRTYADRYRARVEQFRRLEDERQFSRDHALTRAVAKSLYKLMACKDEYEVARLYSDGAFQKYLESRFEGEVRLTYHLAPPLLSRKDRSGRIHKRRFPAATLWLFRLLARLRFLRGGPFDLFRYLPERKEEQATLQEFESLLDRIAGELSDENYPVALELAQLPMQIRGFGHIKSANLAQARVRQAALLKKFTGQILSVKAVDQAA